MEPNLHSNKLSLIPRGVWILGGVSLLMDISSEMIHGLLPLFMMTTLGVSAFTIGVIEGVAESTALIMRIFSGILSDYLGKRKYLVLLGYTLAAFTKPLFALANNIELVFTARFADRIGKGIRGAPRDALITDITPSSLRGAAFGLRQSLDTIGALLGPLLATGLMLLWSNNFRSVFWVASIPAFLAVIVLFLGVHEPKNENSNDHLNPLTYDNLKKLDASYWWVVGIGAIFTLARFSEAFLVLRAQQNGFSLATAPFVMVLMNIIYALSAYPFGSLSDRMNHYQLLSFGIFLLIIADLVLAINDSWQTILIGIIFWGLHMGITQGLLARMVADTAPLDLRGTAFGIFNLVSGIAMLLASVIAGLLWDLAGASSTFYAGTFFCLLSLIGLNRRSANKLEN